MFRVDFGPLILLVLLVLGLGLLAFCVSLGFGIASLVSLLRREPDPETALLQSLISLGALCCLAGSLLLLGHTGPLWVFSVPPLGLAMAALAVWCSRRPAQARGFPVEISRPSRPEGKGDIPD